MKAKSRLGEKFDRLTIINDDGLASVRCICECGNVTDVLRLHLRRGIVRSCGCIPIDGDTREVILTKGRVAIVDASDFASLSQVSWAFSSTGYASRKVKFADGTSISDRMHRRIMGLATDDPRVVDHIDGDTLNNRRSNLRVCSRAENMRNSKLNIKNTSGLKGVSSVKGRNKWQATIRHNGKKIFLGYFGTKEEAHAAYCRAAEELHGEFANTTGHQKGENQRRQSC